MKELKLIKKDHKAYECAEFILFPFIDNNGQVSLEINLKSQTHKIQYENFYGTVFLSQEPIKK